MPKGPERLTRWMFRHQQPEKLDIDHGAQIDLAWAADEINRLSAERARIQAVVDEQAENEGLWHHAVSAPESYLQTELRRLHEVIEGKTGDEIARDLVSNAQGKRNVD